MPKFHVTNAATADLRNIGRYTEATWGRAQRRRYLDGINSKFAFLAENPRLSRQRTEFTPAVRIHPHDNHLIVYQDTSGGVLILRVLHQNMDIRTQLESS